MTALMLFQKRPDRVEAMQWDNTAGTARQIAEWTDLAGWVFQISRPTGLGGYVFELIGPDGTPVDVCPNDWIVHVSQGIFQVMRPHAFSAAFERVMV